MDVDGGNTNSHTLTGLVNGLTYTISIVGTSSSSVLSSAPVSAGTVTLGKGVHSSHFIHTSIAIIHHAQLLCPATNVCASHSASNSNSTSSSLLLLRLQFLFICTTSTVTALILSAINYFFSSPVSLSPGSGSKVCPTEEPDSSSSDLYVFEPSTLSDSVHTVATEDPQVARRPALCHVVCINRIILPGPNVSPNSTASSDSAATSAPTSGNGTNSTATNEEPLMPVGHKLSSLVLCE